MTFHCFKRASQTSPEIIDFLRQYIEKANKEGFRKCSYSIQQHPAGPESQSPKMGVTLFPQKGVVTPEESPRPVWMLNCSVESNSG
jgi:hypothetical protein